MAIQLHNNTPLYSEEEEDDSFSLKKSVFTTATWSSFGGSDSGSVSGSAFGSETEASTEEEENSDFEEEESYCAVLSRQMAQYMLQDDDHHPKTLGCVDEDFKNINLNTNNNRNRTEDFQFKQALIDDQIRAIKAMMKQNKTESSSSSSMRSTRASSSGTGVFLPTRTGSASSYSSDQSKRAGCPTILIPARVVQALKQHFDKVGANLPSTLNGRSTYPFQQHGVMLGGKNRIYTNHHQKNKNQSMNKQEIIGLPQEWTY